MTELHPSDGARFLFELRAEDGDRATYQATVYTPRDSFGYSALLTMDGAVDLAADESSAPGDLEGRLSSLAKSLGRAARRKREDGLPPWPPRVLRWRGPGRG